MGIMGAKKCRKHLLKKIVSAACISLLCCSTTSKLLQSMVRATGYNLLVTIFSE